MVMVEEQEGEANPKPTHVYVLVNCLGGTCGTGNGLFEVEIQPGGEITGAKDDCLKPIAHFFDKKTYVLPEDYRLQAVRVSQPHRHCSSTSKLYLLIREYERVLAPHNGFVFNTENRSLATIPPLRGPKRNGLVFSAYGKIYSLAIRVHSEWLPPRASFACYDLSSRKKKRTIWEKLPSFPYSKSRGTWIYGYAVCHGCILFSLDFEFWVFHIDTKTWHPVELPEEENFCAYFTFNGRAVIVDDTIYALSTCRFGTVVSFSFRIHLEGDGCNIYSLERPYLFEPWGSWCGLYNPQTQYLVPLGKLQFCLVQTDYGYDLLITTFEIVRGGDGGKMQIKTLHSTRRAVDIDAIHEGYGRFSINFAYTLECEDFEPGEEFMEKRNAKKKRRNRNKKKNFNWDTDDSDCEFLDPNSWLPYCMESQRNIRNQDKRKRKGKMKDVKFLGSYAGDVVQSIKVIDSIGPECEVSVPGGQAACLLKKKNAKKKKRNRNKKMNFNLNTEDAEAKFLDPNSSPDTEDSEAKFLDPNSSLPLVKHNESQGKTMDAKFPDPNTGDVIQSVKKKRNRNKKKISNLYTKDSEAENRDPNSSLPLVKYNESKGTMMDAKFSDPHTRDVIESVKVIGSTLLECEDSVPGGQEACQLKKKWSDKEQRNWKKRNNLNRECEDSEPGGKEACQLKKKWSDKGKGNWKKRNNLSRYTEGSEAEYWDPNSSFPLWSDEKEKQNWKKRNNLNGVLEDVGPKEKTTSDDGSAFLDSNQDTSTERRKPSSGGISENSRSSDSQVVKSGSQPSLWFAWFKIMEALSLFLLLLEEVEYFFCPWTKPSYWDKSLEKRRLVISENSGGGGRSLSQVVKSTCWSAWFGFEDAISLFGLVLDEIFFFIIPWTKPLDCGRCDMCRRIRQGRLGRRLH